MIYRFFKRFFDVVCALIGIIGKDNKPFKMYKFRSMRVLRQGQDESDRPIRFLGALV